MREQLIRYIDLLFAGAEGAGDVKQEILQNTLDRYDDLVAQGKTPQGAYSLAISGIGDLSEILNQELETMCRDTAAAGVTAERKRPLWKRIATAVAIALYILSVLPLFILSEMGMEVIGLCGTLSIVAVATVTIIIAGDDEDKKAREKAGDVPGTPRQELRKAVKKAISTAGTVIYFVVSFASGAWHITWLIFPIMAAVQGIVTACMDLKEAKEYEK